MEKTFSKAIVLLKLDLLEMKCLPTDEGAKNSESEAAVSSLSGQGTGLLRPRSSFTRGQGRAWPASDRE